MQPRAAAAGARGLPPRAREPLVHGSHGAAAGGRAPRRAAHAAAQLPLADGERAEVLPHDVDEPRHGE